MSFARSAFILAAIPFTLIAVLWLFLEQALPGSPGTDKGWIFALGGGTFIYGSIYSLRGELPLSSLVLMGLFLNMIGAMIWIPALSYRSGNSIGFAGAALALLWVRAIYLSYREARH